MAVSSGGLHVRNVEPSCSHTSFVSYFHFSIVTCQLTPQNIFFASVFFRVLFKDNVRHSKHAEYGSGTV
jgi:hypothetical protein